MEEFEKKNKEKVINESNINNKIDLLPELLNSDIKNCVFKMDFIIENGNKSESKKGTGFVCNISNIKAFITNNHILNQEFLDNEKKLIIYNYKDEKKEINLDLDRYKYTNEELDFTVIEIIKEDNIKDYLEIDESIDSTDYKNKKICSLQYEDGVKLQYLHGECLGLKDNYLLYSEGKLGKSSGSPIILIDNKKIIGLHKEGYNDNKNIGIPMNLIINKINFIKCIYNIGKKDIGKEIVIINDEYYYFNKYYKNNEIKNKIKIMLNGEEIKSLTYKFNKEGKYTVYLYVKEPIINMSAMFYGCFSLNEINLLSFKTDDATNMKLMFAECSSLKKINLSSFKTDKVTDMNSMFYMCSSLTKIDLSSFKTDKVTDMGNMFCDCKELQEINLSSFKTDNLTNMSFMFSGCSSLKEINLTTFKTDKVTDMSEIFYKCSLLKEIDLSSFKTDNVTKMNYIFRACSSLKKINLSTFKTSNLVDMRGMFVLCSSLEEIDLSSFKTDNVTNMS